MAEKNTSIYTLIDRLRRHPLVADVPEETILSYVIEFIGITGVPESYENKIAELEVKDYVAELPCDFESIIQVMSEKGLSMVESSDSYFTDPKRHKLHEHPSKSSFLGNSYRIQGNLIYFSFEKGKVTLSYKAIPVDSDGIPLIPDNQNFLMAMEWYVKVRVFSIMADLGKLPVQSLNRAEQEYAWYVGKYQTSMKMNSLGKAERLLNSLNTLVMKTHEFQNGFRRTADGEVIKIH
jgi:hypothetical protein